MGTVAAMHEATMVTLIGLKDDFEDEALQYIYADQLPQAREAAVKAATLDTCMRAVEQAYKRWRDDNEA